MSDTRHETQEEIPKIDIMVVFEGMRRAMFHFAWLMIAIVSLCASISFIHDFASYTPRYEASVSYTVQQSSLYGSNINDSSTATSLGKTFQAILKSQATRVLVAREMGTSKVPGQISVSVDDETNVMTITTTAVNPDTAKRLLNAVLKVSKPLTRTVVGDTNLTELQRKSDAEIATVTNPFNKTRSGGIGVIVGLIIDFFFLLVISLTRHTVRTEEDIKRLSNVSCIGVVPIAHFKRRRRNEKDGRDLVLISNFRVPSGFKESIRSIRTRLEIFSREKQAQVFLVTSALPGEGKSTIAANIALSLAMRGKSVVIADLDLRHPCINEAFGLDRFEVGSREVLTQQATLLDTLVQYDDLPLYILPGSNPVYQTADLLHSSRVSRLVEDLRQIADYVILDTPPCAALSDAIAISSFADSGIFVIRQDYSKSDRIAEGMQTISESGASLCGCVLNGAEAGKNGYTYAHSYGHGSGESGRYGYGSSGYGYGYGERKDGHVHETEK